MYECIDNAPVWQAADIAVVNKKIGFDFTTEITAFIWCVFIKILVDSVKMYAALFTPRHALIQQFSFTHAPENELVSFINEFAQSDGCKRHFFSYFRITMLHNGTIEIYCYLHIVVYYFSFVWGIPTDAAVALVMVP